MYKVSEHLKQFHIAAGAHHVALGKAHKARAGSTDGDEKEFHQECAKAHCAAAEYHVTACQKLEDAPDSMPAPSRENRTHDEGQGLHAADAFDELRKQMMVPSDVKLVIPDHPNLRAIPRPGGPEVEVQDATELIDRICRE